ncbi:MAG: hypothetical protein ACYDDU_06430 [Dermatophilaceae bacterium]
MTFVIVAGPLAPADWLGFDVDWVIESAGLHAASPATTKVASAATIVARLKVEDILVDLSNEECCLVVTDEVTIA